MARVASIGEIVENGARRDSRPIDLVHLAKQCLGDEELEREVLALFDTTIVTYLGRLESSTTTDELVMNLHAIRGASAGIGAFTVAELAQTAERDLREGRPVDPERIQDVAMAIEEVRSYISGMIGELE
jgi:HPt (histidine-containing phosphotransfer) domain-containing protein